MFNVEFSRENESVASCFVFCLTFSFLFFGVDDCCPYFVVAFLAPSLTFIIDSHEFRCYLVWCGVQPIQWCSKQIHVTASIMIPYRSSLYRTVQSLDNAILWWKYRLTICFASLSVSCFILECKCSSSSSSSSHFHWLRCCETYTRTYVSSSSAQCRSRSTNAWNDALNIFSSWIYLVNRLQILITYLQLIIGASWIYIHIRRCMRCFMSLTQFFSSRFFVATSLFEVSYSMRFRLIRYSRHHHPIV